MPAFGPGAGNDIAPPSPVPMGSRTGIKLLLCPDANSFPPDPGKEMRERYTSDPKGRSTGNGPDLKEEMRGAGFEPANPCGNGP